MWQSACWFWRDFCQWNEFSRTRLVQRLPRGISKRCRFRECLILLVFYHLVFNIFRLHCLPLRLYLEGSILRFSCLSVYTWCVLRKQESNVRASVLRASAKPEPQQRIGPCGTTWRPFLLYCWLSSFQARYSSGFWHLWYPFPSTHFHIFIAIRDLFFFFLFNQISGISISVIIIAVLGRGFFQFDFLCNCFWFLNFISGRSWVAVRFSCSVVSLL